MKKLITSSIALASFLALLLLFGHAAPVHAATADGQISGQVIDGSNKNAPVPNLNVTLQMAQNSTTSDVTSVKTDAHGNFTFKKVSTDQTISYVVYARYQEAQYVSDSLSLNNKPSQSTKLQVYEEMHSTKNIAILQANVLVRNTDPAKGLITISQVYSFDNLNPKTYVGSLNASSGMPNALLFSLPDGVRNITLGAGFSGYQVLQVDKGFATNAALLPGTNDFSFSYEVPYTTSNYTLSYKTIYPTVSLSFLIDPDLHASSKELSSAGIVNTDNQVYHNYTAATLPASSAISITLQGLPLSKDTNGSFSLNTEAIWLIVGFLVLIAVVLLITWGLYRSRRMRFGASKQSLEGSVSKGNTKKVDPQHTLLQELLVLDADYAAGKITKGAYEEKRSRTKARLRLLMSEKESVKP
jgi:5-hydroxyisourate hydrolase-like protein (transthyretin family)